MLYPLEKPGRHGRLAYQFHCRHNRMLTPLSNASFFAQADGKDLRAAHS